MQSSGLAFRIHNVHSDTVDFRYDYEVLGRVWCDFEMLVDGVVIMAHPYFNFFELAEDLDRWQQMPLEEREDFEHESMDAEEKDLVWFRRHGDGWRVGSPWQSKPAERSLSLESIDQEVTRYTPKRFVKPRPSSASQSPTGSPNSAAGQH